MGHQIVKQPDGKYALWSSVVDDFIIINFEDAKEIVEYYVDEFRSKQSVKINEIIAQLDRGEKPYYQLTNSFDECVDIIRDLHGDSTESLKLLGLKKGDDG